tara:strand:+ start:89 stop:220 length:132 start_codon:yes stop_codon:yes gene_type:complete
VFYRCKRLSEPHELSELEKEYAMGAYLMMFAALATSPPPFADY